MNHLRSFWGILALLLMFPFSSSAQNKLSLDECVALALENNYSMQSAQLKNQLAIEKKREVFTSFFPTIEASASVFEFNRDAIAFNILDIIPIGFVKSGSTASVMATQPIFVGGRIVNGNKLAKVGVEVSNIERQKTEDEVRVAVEKYYWEVAMLQSKLQTIDVLDSLLEQLVHDVSMAVKVGVKMPNDLLQVQLKQNEVEVDRLKVENGLNISKMLLAQYIGMNDVEIESTIHFDQLPEYPLNIKQNDSIALLSSYDYRLLEKNVEASQLNKRIELGKHLPTVAIGAGFSSYDFLDERLNRGAVFATISVPISDWWGGSHALKQAKINETLAKQELEDSAQLLLIRMQNEWDNVEEAYKQLAISQKSIEQSKENLRLNTNCYKAGTVPLSDLLDAQTLFQQAHDNFVEAFAAYHIALSEYQKDTSSLSK